MWQRRYSWSDENKQFIVKNVNHYNGCFIAFILSLLHRPFTPRYIKVKVEHNLLFMFSPPKLSWVISGIKYICLHLLPVFYLIQPSSKQIICFDFRKQNSVLPIVFYIAWFTLCLVSLMINTSLRVTYVRSLVVFDLVDSDFEWELDLLLQPNYIFLRCISVFIKFEAIFLHFVYIMAHTTEDSGVSNFFIDSNSKIKYWVQT